MYKKLPNHTRESVDFCNAKEFDLHTKNKEKRLTKTWNQAVPIPDNGAKIWSRENHAQKVYVLKLRFKMCVLWLPRYFRYSIEAKTSRIHKDGGDRSLHGMFTCMLTVLQCLKEWKENKTKNEKRSTVKHKEVGNIEKNDFCDFCISKTK